jgi:hypothetical protein
MSIFVVAGAKEWLAFNKIGRLERMIGELKGVAENKKLPTLGSNVDVAQNFFAVLVKSSRSPEVPIHPKRFAKTRLPVRVE